MTMTTMVTVSTIAAIVAIAPYLQSSNQGIILTSAFTTSHFSPWSRSAVSRRPTIASSSWSTITTTLSAAGKGFGDKPASTQKSKASSSTSIETTASTTSTSSPSSSTEGTTFSSNIASTEENTGSTMLQQLRSREAEKRDAELRKLRDLRDTDALLAEDASAAAIPERVAQRMGKRMVPFVGIPLFGSFASFIGFWYLATYKDMEFQPAIVATTSFVFLAVGLLGITYSVLSSSWDEDREGSGFGADEFQKNIGNIKEGLSRTKENALLRERMAGLSEEEIQRAIDDQERREKSKKQKDAWME